MAKGKIIGVDGKSLSKKVPTVQKVTPTGARVLVEVITADELNSTSLELPEGAAIDDVPQGYIMAISSQIKEPGFAVGDRVILDHSILSGSFTPTPERDLNNKRKNIHRPLIMVEQHQIKAVLEEEK